MAYPKEYMNEKVVVTKADLYIGGLWIGEGWMKNVDVRWDDIMIEAPDINDNYTLCVAKVITTELIEATYAVYVHQPMFSTMSDHDRYYIYRKGVKYRVVQHRVYGDVEGKEMYRELLLSVVPYT
jgi:hypothetical protein